MAGKLRIRYPESFNPFIFEIARHGHYRSPRRENTAKPIKNTIRKLRENSCGANKNIHDGGPEQSENNLHHR